jgi:predicted metalloprotease with PDZ domain
MNGDKTIYGRFGTRSHQTRSEDDVSLEGFAEALEAGLKIHANYPANGAELAGKQPRLAPAIATPEQFPRLKTFTAKPDYEGRVAAGCIHCHQVGESLHAVLRDEGKPIPTELLFPYPHPKVLGLVMDPKHRATVARVEPDSPSARDGFRAGDEIASLGGQPLLSIADMQWVLHNTRDEVELPAAVRRDGKELALKLTLSPGWRARGDISWRATSWALRRMTTGGMRLEELPAERRAEKRIGGDSLALEATHVGEYGEHAHAKNRGFRKGDVIVSVGGQSGRMRESDLFARLVNRPVGEELAVEVLRGEERVRLRLSTQK